MKHSKNDLGVPGSKSEPVGLSATSPRPSASGLSASIPHAEIDARLRYWMRDGAYLPPAFRDFHAQKDLFKTIHDCVLVHKHEYCGDVSWVAGQCYVVDVFLWFMARHGYTLQRSRNSVPHFDLDATLKASEELRHAAFAEAMGLRLHRDRSEVEARRSQPEPQTDGDEGAGSPKPQS